MGNNNEEMRKMLKEMSDYPYDVFDYGCTSFGEAAAWALKTMNTQQAEIEKLKADNRKLYREYLDAIPDDPD